MHSERRRINNTKDLKKNTCEKTLGINACEIERRIESMNQKIARACFSGIVNRFWHPGDHLVNPMRAKRQGAFFKANVEPAS